jgi:hypothetical protein
VTIATLSPFMHVSRSDLLLGAFEIPIDGRRGHSERIAG